MRKRAKNICDRLACEISQAFICDRYMYIVFVSLMNNSNTTPTALIPLLLIMMIDNGDADDDDDDDG